MGKVFFDAAISLDAFMAGDNRGPDNPLGDGGRLVHQWMFVQKAFWDHHGKEDGEEDGNDGRLIDYTFARTGACIMGKRMFEEGEANWPENLFKTDVFVLTHEKRDPWVQKGSTTFYFINDGIDSALEKARKSAKTKDIRIQGGANTIQQYLNAGFVDEFMIHLSPVFIGSGLRLFDKMNKDLFTLEIEDLIESGLTTHIKYKVFNKK